MTPSPHPIEPEPPAPETVTSDITDETRYSTGEVFPLVYAELRRLARMRLAKASGQSLQPTALVHEAFLRLEACGEARWQGRGHFLATAATAMRRILLDRARQAKRHKRGGDQLRVTLPPDLEQAHHGPEDLIAIDQALSKLERRDAVMAQVVQLRYFAGLTIRETSEATGLSVRSVNRHWFAARAWLYDEISRRSGEGRTADG